MKMECEFCGRECPEDQGVCSRCAGSMDAAMIQSIINGDATFELSPRLKRELVRKPGHVRFLELPFGFWHEYYNSGPLERDKMLDEIVLKGLFANIRAIAKNDEISDRIFNHIFKVALLGYIDDLINYMDCKPKTDLENYEDYFGD